VNRLADPGHELAVALELAEALGALPASGVAAAKQAFNGPVLEEAARLEHLVAW
jgi:hypothetical protein